MTPRVLSSASNKQQELVKVLTAAWEKKNSKAARAGGVSLMALTLAACGSSEDTTPFSQADLDASEATGYDAGVEAAAEVVAGLTTANNTLAATNSTLTTANSGLEDENGVLTAANNDLTADLETANETITTINDTDYASEQAAYNAGEDAGAASRDDEVAGLNATITTLNDTDYASEQAAYDAGETAGAASRDSEVQGLNTTIQDLQNTIAAYEAVAARTIDEDGDAIALSTSGTIIVAGTTAGADTLNASVDAGGNATVIFDFADADDTVVLTSADFTGVTAIEVQDGTVDFTAVTLPAGIALTLGSGAVLTAAQATSLASIALRAGATSYDLTVNVSAGDDIAALTTALTAAGAGGNITVAAADGALTPAQSTALAAVSTVENASGGAVVTTNAAPAVADAETTAVDGSTDAVAMTAAASVTDAEGNWNGGTIVIAPEAGYLIGEANAAEGLTISGTLVASATVPYQYSVISGSVIATDVDGNTMVVGTVVNNGSTTDTTAAVVAYSSVQITLNGNATDAIVSDLLTEMRFDGVVDSTAGAVDEATVTVTVTDASGASTSFARLVDSDGATSIAGLNDDREVEAADMAAGTLTYDNGGNAALTNNGLDLDGATLTIASSVSSDTIDATPAGYTVTSGNLIAGGAIIGTISGDASSSVTITFNENAANANVNAIINGALVTGTAIGAHDITTTLTEATGDSSVTDTTTITVVGDFGGVTGIGGNAAVAAGTSAAPVELADILNVASVDDAITFSQNTYVNIGTDDYTATAAQDLQAQVDAGYLVVGSGVEYVRLVTDGASTTFDAVTNLGALGSNIVWSGIDENLEVTVAQVSGATIDTTGNITIVDLEGNLAADLSGIESTGGVESASIDSDGDVTFTGDLGNFAVSVNDTNAGTGTLTIAASIADGKTIAANANETIVVTGVTSSDAYDLSGLSNSGGTGEVTINFDADTTLAATTNLGATGANIDVVKNVTLTLTAAQADTLTIDGDQAVGDNTTGGSIAVTALDATLGADLSGLTAGAANAGAIGTSAGSVTAAFDNDGTFTGDFGSAIVTVAADATLTAAETVATGVTIRGEGSVVVTHTAAGNNFDLSGITTSSLEFAVAASADITGDTIDLGTATVTVDVDQTLTINASDISGVTATGDAADDGETGGSFVVTMDAATALDLSTISAGGTVDTDEDGSVGTAGSLTANIADGTALHATTDLGSFDLVLGDDADLSITAAQADDRSIDGTAAGNVETLSIDVSNAAADFDISGIGSNIDTTTLTSTGSINLSGMTLDASVGSVVVNDGDNAIDADYTVTMTASQADAMNTENGGAAVVTLTSGDSADSIAITVTAVTATDANSNDDFTDDTGVTYIASAGDDTLYGSTGIDDITGGDGADNIDAGTGVDTIAGGNGADIINGGDGDDNITGGAGKDTITGGDGDDTFVYGDTDSAVGANRDIIIDFSDYGIAGGDLIDLSGLTWTGTGAFIGTAQFDGDATNGQVRYVVTGGNAIVEVDYDADGASDLQIQLNGVDVLASSDFTL